MPSLIEFATGRDAATAVNLPLEDVPLRSLLTERLGLPVYVENDASCAALAEAYDDGEMVRPDLVMFTVGTGVGGGSCSTAGSTAARPARRRSSATR